MRSNNDQEPETAKEHLARLWIQLGESQAVEAEKVWMKQELERKCDILEAREELLSSLLSSYMRVNDHLKNRVTRLRLLATEQEIINRNLREWQPQPEAPSLIKPVEQAAPSPAAMVKAEVERELQPKKNRKQEQKRSSFAGLRLLCNIIFHLMRWSCKLLFLLLLLYMVLQSTGTFAHNCRCFARGLMEAMEHLLRPYLILKVEGQIPT
ncbi:uncharacterized protein LOC142100993 [Mixophyes fleayi]|uniref:uncharacterized protein LOC142100993 n=1 Tax=Mixophyes fleayi TaxID=3061075 RepID=UPI003F4D99FB